MTIKLGSFTIDDTYSPSISSTYEYFTTSTGEIIGGSKVITITGTTTIQSGTNSASSVMTKLKSIRDLGKNTKCINVSIGSLHSGQAKITNVSIDQGPDPSWVNQGSFSIEVKAQLDSISNSLGVTADDHVQELSSSQTIELGEDSHGYVFLDDNTLSKAYVKFSSQVSVTCRPLCPNKIPQELMIDLIKKLAKFTPDSDLLQDYKNWKPYAQSRSFDMTGSNQASFSTEIILLPPTSSAGAFVDLQFEHSKNYTDNIEIKKVTGTINGLSSISWSGDLVGLNNTSSNAKFDQADSVFQKILSKYKTIDNWEGLMLELTEKPNCPPVNSKNSPSASCKKKSSSSKSVPLRAKSSTVSKSRTEGSINFNFEWDSTNNCADESGFTSEVLVDIVEPQKQIVEHVIPSYGTLFQDLKSCNAKRINFTSNVNANGEDALCNVNALSLATTELARAEGEYLKKGVWLLIESSRSTSNKNVSITKQYIESC